MSEKTQIAWCNSTWNPVRGCSVVSPGCTNCYAMTMAHNRFGGLGMPYEGLTNKHGAWNGRIRLVPHMLDQPRKWRKPRMIFVNSMSDLFHEGVSFEFIDQVFGVMVDTPRHVYQILSKRARRMSVYARHGPQPDNLWLGVSVETREYVDRVGFLLDAIAPVRWVSAEPLLGPLALEPYLERLDWVVCGAESGPEARPMHLDWARSLRDQCADRKVPFFMKQLCHNGRKIPLDQWPEDLRIREWPQTPAPPGRW